MPQLVALVDDLMFLSRIREAARASAIEVRAVRDASSLPAASGGEPRLVLVDADSERLPWRETLAALRAEPAFASVPVVAFVSHARADLAEAALAAGANRVLARSRFVKELPELVAQAAMSTPAEEPIP
jgi:CheY-like chemotaxis protein